MERFEQFWVEEHLDIIPVRFGKIQWAVTEEKMF